eukprot:6468311-Amphidinium_carterae.5
MPVSFCITIGKQVHLLHATWDSTQSVLVVSCCDRAEPSRSEKVFLDCAQSAAYALVLLLRPKGCLSK